MTPTRALRATLMAGAALAWPGSVRSQEPVRLPLNRAVTLAMEHMPTLDAARAAVLETQGSAREAWAGWWPRLSVDGQVFQFEEQMIVAPIHELSAAAVRFDQTTWQANAVLGFLLFDGGARSGRIAQTRALGEAAEAGLRDAEQTVVAAVTQTYGEVHAAHTVVQAAGLQLRALRAEADRVSQFLAEGRAARVERMRVDAAVASATADSASAASRLATREAALARLTGLAVDSVRAESLDPLAVRRDTLAAREPLLAAALAASPAVEAARRRGDAAGEAVRVAQGDWYPSVRLEGRTVTYGDGSGYSTTEWQVGARVSYPLFTGGARGGAVDRARAQEERALAEARSAELDVAGRLDAVLAALDESRARVTALDEATTWLAEVVRTEQLALSQGAGVQSDYLRAEADLARSRAELAGARSAELSARIELERVLGRLDRTTLATLVGES